MLEVEHLTVGFPAGSRGERVHAVSDVNFTVGRRETLGLVGESGCGKLTTGRAVAQLPRPNAGRVRFDGVELTALRGEPLRRQRRRMPIVFQDPVSSLNPRRRVDDIVGKPLALAGVRDHAGGGGAPASSWRPSGSTRPAPTAARTCSPEASASG